MTWWCKEISCDGNWKLMFCFVLLVIDDQVTEGSGRLRKDPNLLGRRRAPRRTASAGATSEGVSPTLQQGESGIGRGAWALPKESFNSSCNRLLGLPQQRCVHAIPWWKFRPCHAGKNPSSLNDHSHVSSFYILKCSNSSLSSARRFVGLQSEQLAQSSRTPNHLKHQDGFKFDLCKPYSLPYSIQFAW